MLQNYYRYPIDYFRKNTIIPDKILLSAGRLENINWPELVGLIAQIYLKCSVREMHDDCPGSSKPSLKRRNTRKFVTISDLQKQSMLTNKLRTYYILQNVLFKINSKC